MSAAKRRIKRKIKQLVRMLETIALMPWNRRYRMNQNLLLAERQERLFSNAQALGIALGRKGHQARAQAAIDESIRANENFTEVR